MKYKRDIDKVREKFDFFWNNEYAGRALIAVVAPKQPGYNISMFHNDDREMYRRLNDLRDYWENPEVIYKNNIKRLERTYFAGESIPIVFQNYGTSGHCNYIGAIPSYGNDTIWFNKVYDSIENIPASIDEEVLKKHLAIARYMTDHAGDSYFVGMPDHCGTLDAIAHIFGTSELLMEMYENPEGVRKAVTKVNRIWMEANEKFYNISTLQNNGGAHAWMHLLAPGRLQHMQCDLSVMISPDMFAEFVIPELEEQMKWIQYPIYHFDGIEQERHLDHILSLEKLKAIQWTEVAGQPSPANYLPVLQRIQKAGKRLIIMCPPDDIKPLLEGLSAKGLYLHTTAGNPEQAEQLVKIAEKYSKE